MPKKRKHILVADDDAVYRDVAKASLEHAGHLVSVAIDGREAISLLASQSFDAAIIDLTMPGADGITVIQTLRSGGVNATIPVIVITGHDEASAVSRAYEAGATSFLTKPLNWLLFTPHVEFVLRSGDIENELREATATLAFLSDLKSQMMAALAQEFQTPIKTIFGFSQLMEKEVYGAVAPSAYREMISDISKSAHGLNTALLKVMNFGRALHDNLQFNAEDVSARDAVRTAIAAIEPHALRRDIRISADIDISNESLLRADPSLLSQALRSVIENAVRLSPRGGEVVLRAQLSNDGGMVLSIGDSGPPLSADLVMEINGTSKPTQGFMAQSQSSAVSIKIAKILTEAHHGTFTIRSHPDGGNLVELTIPFDKCRTDSDTTERDPATTSIERLARISAELSNDPRIMNKLGGQATAGRSGSQALAYRREET